jgi:hypothetical protein
MLAFVTFFESNPDPHFLSFDHVLRYGLGIPLPFKSGEKIMSNSSSKGTALITGASRDYDFNLSKLERVMSGAADKVTALGHELERRRLKRTIVVTGKTLGPSLSRQFRLIDPQAWVDPSPRRNPREVLRQVTRGDFASNDYLRGNCCASRSIR